MGLVLHITPDFAEVMAYEQFRPGILDLESVLAGARRGSLRSTESVLAEVRAWNYRGRLAVRNRDARAPSDRAATP